MAISPELDNEIKKGSRTRCCIAASRRPAFSFADGRKQCVARARDDLFRHARLARVAEPWLLRRILHRRKDKAD
jgi:hypothetical protein